MDDFFKNSQVPDDPSISAEELVRFLREENQILRRSHAELIRKIEDMNKNTFFDELTGLYSRIFFEQEIDRIAKLLFKEKYDKEDRRVSSNKEKEEGVSLLVFDLDEFGKINDANGGRAAGDIVIKSVAQAVRESVRDSDLSARWGGDEIIVMILNTSEDQAIKKAEEIRNRIENLSFVTYDNFPLLKQVKATASFGVAHSSDFSDLKSFLHAVDGAVIRSKEKGRNRVTAHSKVV